MSQQVRKKKSERRISKNLKQVSTILKNLISFWKILKCRIFLTLSVKTLSNLKYNILMNHGELQIMKKLKRSLEILNKLTTVFKMFEQTSKSEAVFASLTKPKFYAKICTRYSHRYEYIKMHHLSWSHIEISKKFPWYLKTTLGSQTILMPW